MEENKQVWNKGTKVNDIILKFTVGNDYILDQRLVPYDCDGSIAHVHMLHAINILSEEEMKVAVAGLEKIKKEGITITSTDEDCHSAIENYLSTETYGEVGKKIHTGRSRNDQVLTALRLYERDEILKIQELLLQYEGSLKRRIQQDGEIIFPGYTHTRKAMPTTVAMWLGAFVCASKDARERLDSLDKLLDQSPLGSGAGFGIPKIEINRKMTAERLGFSRVMENPIYCQLSRGLFEADIIHVLSQIMLPLNRLAEDMIMFTADEFGFMTLLPAFYTGSSIMPQKKNPDVFELIRSSYHVVVAEEMKIKGIIGNLPSGYNRDVQLTKEALFTAIDTTKGCIEAMMVGLQGTTIDAERCRKALTPDLFATAEANELVAKGVPFREAYRTVSEKYTKK